jgi:hypothetical protein
MNLYEIMRSAAGGEAFAALARQFGLSETEIAKAVEAFVPALSAALKQTTADPLGLMEFMRRMALGNFSQAYGNPMWGAGAGRAESEKALSLLFGSPEVARAVAKQAAAFSGVAQETMQKLMPAFTAMAFGGLAERAMAANPFLDAMLKEVRASARKPAAKGPLDRLEEEQARREAEDDLARTQRDMMRAGFSALQAGTAAWQKAMQETTKGIIGGGAMAGDATQPETEPDGAKVFGEMFESGVRANEAYQRQMEELFGRLRQK